MVTPDSTCENKRGIRGRKGMGERMGEGERDRDNMEDGITEMTCHVRLER